MSTTTPSGWYPDPKPSDPANPGQRWWNGTEWTVSTQPADAPPAARKSPRRATLVVGAVAAVLGLGIGTLATYLIMDGRGSGSGSVSAPSQRYGGGNGLPFGGGGSGGSGGGSGSGGSSGGSGGSGSSSTTAYDIADGISLPIPGGWTGGTTTDGHAGLSFGPYSCSQSSSGCTLGGADTSTLKASVSAGAQAAAEADIATAVKQSYGDITGHTQLESQAVTVAGRSGYLIRWKVDAKVGNSGTVETVVFPTSNGKNLVALHLGFDIATKAPSLSLMDTIVSGVRDGTAGAVNGAPGTNS